MKKRKGGRRAKKGEKKEKLGDRWTKADDNKKKLLHDLWSDKREFPLRTLRDITELENIMNF